VIAAGMDVAPVRGGALGQIDHLLRDRDAMIARIRAGVDLVPTMRTMVATIAVAMAIVGAALGSYRGGVQIGYAAVKLPLVLLGTAALSAPALSAIGAALGRRPRVAVDLALVMTALAYGALLLVATTPLILLARSMDLDYHRAILCVVVLFATAGIASLRVIVRALAVESAVGWRASVFGLCVVFGLVGGQLAWALRPYLVRPRADDVVFVHPVNAREGSLFDAILTAAASARGEYRRDHAPLPGERSW
jgi:hypothetical protein